MIPGPATINSQRPVATWLHRFLAWRYRNKYTFNFIAIIVFLILLPLLADNSVAQVFVDVLIIIVLIFAVHAISDHRTTLAAGIILAVTAVILDVLYYMTSFMRYFHASVIIALVFLPSLRSLFFSG